MNRGTKKQIGASGLNPWFALGLFVVAVYFAYFVLPGLKGRFNDDDPMNIHLFWSRGGLELFKNIILFFTPFYRPMGGLFFFSFYELFGLNPLPYHIAITIILAINVALAYRCASLLSNSKITGAFCALLLAYHAHMWNLVYLPAFIFDVLCFTFYFGAFTYYIGIRSSGRMLGKAQLTLFLALYIASLESKEMAVSLPVMLLAYEMFWNRPDLSRSGLWKWLRSSAVPIILSGIVTITYIVGKSMGPESLLRNTAYQPKITLPVFLQTNSRYFSELFYDIPFSPAWLIFTWLFLAFLAYRLGKNHLRWATVLTIIGPLPVSFIENRGAACLYIVAFGWALWVSFFADGVCHLISNSLLTKLPRHFGRAIPILLLAALLWRYTDFQNKRDGIRYWDSGRLIYSTTVQLQTLLPRMKPGSEIAFYDDGIEFWDMKFITELFYHDRSVKVRLHPKEPLSPEEFQKMDYVLNVEHQRISILKRPGEPFRPPR